MPSSSGKKKNSLKLHVPNLVNAKKSPHWLKYSESISKSAAIGNNSVSSTTSQSLPSTTMPSPSVQTVNISTYTTVAAAGNGTTQTSSVMYSILYINISTKHFNRFYNNDAIIISKPTITICNSIASSFFTIQFYFKISISNKIQKCQGCQLQFRQPGVSVVAPHDLIVLNDDLTRMHWGN